ncbi:transcription termination/antitermination factor NusG [Candidatus Saganbacteria bacterium CG08_land_8_20_14_0_20_45_16]|uniref:Transcription termination/antitermination protein NusG n=1 Tax=Candidatus Saganbacteria bacterium CG08_land_8_20_14_0_20_45_16 TaxID=2014293 RepID=A0A2H0XXC5_UNCSA|nr:MAG: transcription termination/antitermination factor NusG [Candidatus Saganbacteria bacterium CG08_land_8_20_14_0_20_45_16]
MEEEKKEGLGQNIEETVSAAEPGHEQVEKMLDQPAVASQDAEAKIQPEENSPVPGEQAIVSPEKTGPDQVEGKQPLPVAEGPEQTDASVGERHWYVIQALTGQEDKVKQSIELTIRMSSLKDKVFQVLVPTEEIVEIKGGKRLVKVKKMFPGYVFLDMILTEETWYLMRETPGVARFIGTKVQPTPVSGKEMQRVLKQLGKEERLEITFERGEVVRVISGAFRGYTGTVDEVNAERGKLKILINIFGRDTPVEVNFEHAQKIV